MWDAGLRMFVMKEQFYPHHYDDYDDDVDQTVHMFVFVSLDYTQ